MFSATALSALMFLQSSPMVTVGPGNDSCGQWSDARQSGRGRDTYYGAWLGGYLSGINASGERDVLRGRRMADAMLWVDRFCRDNPTMTIKSAASALVAHLAVS